jgi:hypothetical protein
LAKHADGMPFQNRIQKSSHGQCRKEWSTTITLNNQKECGSWCVTFKARLAIVVLCHLVPYL